MGGRIDCAAATPVGVQAGERVGSQECREDRFAAASLKPSWVGVGPMDEATWLACTDPGPMLKYLRWQGDSRKWRLFACACCCQVWDRLADDRLCRAVDLGEQYAEGLISVQEISGFRASGEGTSAWVAAKRRARSVAQVGDREVQCHLLRCLFRSPFR